MTEWFENKQINDSSEWKWKFEKFLKSTREAIKWATTSFNNLIRDNIQIHEMDIETY